MIIKEAKVHKYVLLVFWDLEKIYIKNAYRYFSMETRTEDVELW
jgi:hypothetical protein